MDEQRAGRDLHRYRSKLAAMRKDAAIVCRMLELGDQRLLASDGPAGGQLPDLSPDEWGEVYRACKRIAAQGVATDSTPSATRLTGCPRCTCWDCLKVRSADSTPSATRTIRVDDHMVASAKVAREVGLEHVVMTVKVADILGSSDSRGADK